MLKHGSMQVITWAKRVLTKYIPEECRGPGPDTQNKRLHTVKNYLF